MKNKSVQRWRNKGLSFALAFAMVMQSSMVGYAAELQTPMVDISEVKY